MDPNGEMTRGPTRVWMDGIQSIFEVENTCRDGSF